MKGKRVLVVGASSGIGRAIGVAAVRAGGEVALAARQEDKLVEAAEDGGGGTVVVGDVRSADDCQRMVDEAVAALGGLDLVVYAVGYTPLRPLRETDADDFRAIFETNVLGVHQIATAAVPQLSEAGIVAVLSSETVGRPRTGFGVYSASKAAVEELLRAWRVEHTEVRFSCLAVGATVPTEFGRDFDPDLLGPALEDWIRHGFMQRDFMDAADVGSLLVGVLGVALAHPSLGVEHVSLRSPSPVVGGGG